MDLVVRVFAFLDCGALLSRAMASSKLWREIALEHTVDLHIPPKRYFLDIAFKASWPSLQVLRFPLGMSPFDPNGSRLHSFEPGTNKISLRSMERTFPALTALDLGGAQIRVREFSGILKGVSQLTALCIENISYSGSPHDLMNTLAANGKGLRKLALGEQADGVFGSRAISPSPALAPLAKLSHLEVLSLASSSLVGLPTGMSLSKLCLSDPIEGNGFGGSGGPAPVNDNFIRATLDACPLLSLSLDMCDGVTGCSLRSQTLTELVLHGCTSLCRKGLVGMAKGVFPALRKLAFTSPSMISGSVFDDIDYGPAEVAAFIASLHQLTELWLDELVKQDPAADPSYEVPLIVAYSEKHLRAIEQGCSKLETLVVLDESELCTTIFGNDRLPRLYRALCVSEAGDDENEPGGMNPLHVDWLRCWRDDPSSWVKCDKDNWAIATLSVLPHQSERYEED